MEGRTTASRCISLLLLLSPVNERRRARFPFKTLIHIFSCICFWSFLMFLDVFVLCFPFRCRVYCADEDALAERLWVRSLLVAAFAHVLL